jgi:hypothetical protein
MGLAIAEEPVLNGKPNLTCCAAMLMDGRLVINGEGTEEPREDDVVHL